MSSFCYSFDILLMYFCCTCCILSFCYQIHLLSDHIFLLLHPLVILLMSDSLVILLLSNPFAIGSLSYPLLSNPFAVGSFSYPFAVESIFYRILQLSFAVCRILLLSFCRLGSLCCPAFLFFSTPLLYFLRPFLNVIKYLHSPSPPPPLPLNPSV